MWLAVCLRVSHAGGHSGERGRVCPGGLEVLIFRSSPCAPSPLEDPGKFMEFYSQEKLEEEWSESQALSVFCVHHHLKHWVKTDQRYIAVRVNCQTISRKEFRGQQARAAAQCVTGGVHEAGFFAHL